VGARPPGVRSDGRALTPGAFVTFVIYAQQFLWPIIRLGDVVDDYERAKAAGSRVQDVLSRDPTRDGTVLTLAPLKSTRAP